MTGDMATLGIDALGEPAKIAAALGTELTGINEALWQGIRDTYTSSFHANKKFIALDSTTPEGGDVLNALVKISDVSIENWTPRVAQKIGVSYEQLRQSNPQIINCSMRAYGDTGPWASYVAYGSTMEYLSGITSLTGYGYKEGDRPMRVGVYTVDPLASMQAAGAIMSALIYRKRTGKGMNIKLSQYEVATHLVGREVMDYSMNKIVRTPIGNNDRDVPFQGCYPTKGDDQWMVISIRDKTEWSTLCSVIGKLDWLNSDTYNHPSKLEANRKEVDAAITVWTNERTKEDASQFLQNLNIPAAPVNNYAESIFDPQLRHRGKYRWVEHSYGATATLPRMPVNFTKTPLPEVYQPAKSVGADNSYVYHDLLGLSDKYIKELEDKKIIKQ
jgi:crotonobetainyl-CoA:carnitine CoA-transferase CaiB-like acyl-CoA transferase